MSEIEVSRAKEEVEQNVTNFERALDRLLGQVEQGMERADLGLRMKELVDVDGALERTRNSVVGFVSELRQSAEEEIRRMDARPLMTWGAFLAGGIALGYALGKKSAKP